MGLGSCGTAVEFLGAQKNKSRTGGFIFNQIQLHYKQFNSIYSALQISKEFGAADQNRLEE